jgi:hypothetical protein
VYVKEYLSQNGLLPEEKPIESEEKPAETEAEPHSEHNLEQTPQAEPSLDTTFLQSQLKQYKYEFLDQEVMDWATLSHV